MEKMFGKLLLAIIQVQEIILSIKFGEMLVSSVKVIISFALDTLDGQADLHGMDGFNQQIYMVLNLKLNMIFYRQNLTLKDKLILFAKILHAYSILKKIQPKRMILLLIILI